jgi:hypothetical protein
MRDRPDAAVGILVVLAFAAALILVGLQIKAWFSG